jgi:hypothetical protein
MILFGKNISNINSITTSIMKTMKTNKGIFDDMYFWNFHAIIVIITKSTTVIIKAIPNASGANVIKTVDIIRLPRSITIRESKCFVITYRLGNINTVT